MNRIDLYRLYVIGSELHPLLLTSRTDTTVGDLFAPLWNASRAIGELLAPDGPVRLDFCRPSAEKLQSAIKALEHKYFRTPDGNLGFHFSNDTIVPSWEMWSLKTSLETFETVFQTEMQRTATYLVPKRGTYDLGDLVDRANETFPAEVRGIIGPVANDEYINAGRCYAFGLFTASGYHCCRAVEAVLREYYFVFTGKRDKGTEQWGELVGGLEKCAGVLVPEKKTLGHIRHIKDFDRNPLSHVRAVLDETDADILLAASKVAITAMAAEMHRKQLAGAPVLELVKADGSA